ncbi:copper resistance protein CopC [Corynebacterium argentoratense]|uniref:copper resistance CopC family protein n=1 Tax=Corynebacterium argentoratense TaxID=42817 RepID=UPI0028EDD8A9|nr:copper resistance protein CopC [Corynebacterium argentoratense]
MIISPMLPRRVLATVVAVGALTVVATPVALAHDSVIGGTPADGEVVEEFPRSIELEFSGLPQEGFSTVAITDQDSGDLLFSGEPTIDGRLVTLDLPADVSGGSGDYTVGFQILSSDGHATRSATTFTVAGDAQTTATTTGADAEPVEETPAAENTAEEDTSGWSDLIVPTLVGLAVFGAIAGAGVLVVRRRDAR